jgi:hypothetical protein
MGGEFGIIGVRKGVYRILAKKPKEKTPFVRYRRRR